LEFGQARFLDQSAIRWVLFGRAFLGTLFLLAALAVEWSELGGLLNFSPAPIYIYAAAIYASSFFFFLMAVYREDWSRFIFSTALPAMDLGLITWLALYTGGSTSPFLFLYLFIIIGAAVLNLRRGAIIIAALSMVLLGCILLLEYYGNLPHRFLYHTHNATESELLITAFYNITAFYLVGILSSYLAERLRRAGEELDRRELDISILKDIHTRIIDNVSSGILTLDEYGRILLANKPAERILGTTGHALWGRPVQGVLPHIVLQDDERGLRRELQYDAADGDARSLGYSVSHIQLEPGRVGSIVVFQDLTRMKDLEQEVMQQAKLAAVGTMAAGLAHEIRNPLGSISGSLQLLRQQLDALGDEERQLLGIALKEIDQLNDLVNNFLYYAKPFRQQSTPFKLRGLLEEVVEALKHSPDTPSGVVIENRVSDTIELTADPNAIRQVAANLIANAVQAEADHVVLRADPTQDGLLVEFVDNGVGFAPDAMGRLFEPFFTTKAEGVGLGLAIVYRVMEEYQGTVKVQSKPGQTVMTLFFPLREAVET
jgi:two-component system, NtrC family, sensor histidine kinase PilS